jgi:hypothetical protein
VIDGTTRGRRPGGANPAARRRYPLSTQWALLLARHERDELGLYAESAAVAREVLAACERREPGYGAAVEAMARVSLGESLLLDLRLAEARRALLPVRDGIPEAAWVGPTARLLLARSLELEGDREAALAHYSRAAEGPDRGVKRRAREALSAPLPAAEVRAAHFLAEARRNRDGRPAKRRGFCASRPGRLREGRWCSRGRSRAAGDEQRRDRSASRRTPTRAS